MPRFYCPTSLRCGDLLDLPASAARHVQVLRLQPGDHLTLFNGGPGWDAGDAMHPQGGEFDAVVTRMGRSDVQVQLGDYHAVEREAAHQVHLAVGMPANDRMDWLVEKSSELGVTSIQPLITERSVLRLNPERAGKKQAHWQSVAVAASEQCGGNRVPVIHAVMTLSAWLKARLLEASGKQLMLSFRPGAPGVRAAVSAGADTVVARASDAAITFLSGPEGGLSPAEEESALACGFAPVTLGPRVLRAETAALAALAALLN